MKSRRLEWSFHVPKRRVLLKLNGAVCFWAVAGAGSRADGLRERRLQRLPSPVGRAGSGPPGGDWGAVPWDGSRARPILDREPGSGLTQGREGPSLIGRWRRSPLARPRELAAVCGPRAGGNACWWPGPHVDSGRAARQGGGQLGAGPWPPPPPGTAPGVGGLRGGGVLRGERVSRQTWQIAVTFPSGNSFVPFLPLILAIRLPLACAQDVIPF